MNDNMKIWNAVKDVPKEFQKQITGGRLKGMTDIKPQWRYKVMTEQFGQIGFGWYYEILKKEIIDGANGEQCGFVDVALYVNNGESWSQAIVGTGGSSFVSNEKNGLYTSDEVFKMALTDALSVAMAKIGVGASIYMGEVGNGKYTRPEPAVQKPSNDLPWLNPNTKEWNNALQHLKGAGKMSDIKQHYRLSKVNEEKLTEEALS